MKVIREEVMGMCFGVRDALKIIGDIVDPAEVTIHGELVHNETVLGQLEATGFATTAERTVQKIRAAIAERNPGAEIRFVDTVCLPTKDHQRSLERLIERVDAMVVVGGRNSNNTRELAALCRDRGIPALHVQGPGDLD